MNWDLRVLNGFTAVHTHYPRVEAGPAEEPLEQTADGEKELQPKSKATVGRGRRQHRECRDPACLVEWGHSKVIRRTPRFIRVMNKKFLNRKGSKEDYEFTKAYHRVYHYCEG